MITTTKPTPSWRDVLPIHPACKLFPPMSPDELQALGEDIQKNGLTSSIALWRADPAAQLQLIDGRNRLDAIELVIGRPVLVSELGVEIETDSIRWYGGPIIIIEPPADPYAYVVSANIHRRQLTPKQKDDLIAKLLKAAPEKSDRQIARTVKASPTYVGKVRAEKEATGDVSTVDTRTDTRGRQQPAHRAAGPPSKVKFTPERLRQIKNLVERGKSRDQIAEIIGCTVGSLQVTCSRLGISLRRPMQAKVTATPPNRQKPELAPEDLPDDTPQQRWHYSVSNIAGEAISLLAFWDKTFGQEWRSFEVSSDLATLAQQAADAWAQIANELTTRQALKSEIEDDLKARLAAAPPADDGLDIPERLRRPAP
jgi:hypothetical protein